MRERGVDDTRAQQLLAAPRDAIESALKTLRERHGSAEGYARDLRVSDTTLSALRARLIA
ncbi:MAG: tyrosine-protein phosphatase [Dehalococcoidia bacterium]|nr:tyrosine-protein phosphatase [Dehalococcoidia bacterium]